MPHSWAPSPSRGLYAVQRSVRVHSSKIASEYATEMDINRVSTLLCHKSDERGWVRLSWLESHVLAVMAVGQNRSRGVRRVVANFARGGSTFGRRVGAANVMEQRRR